MPSSGELIDLLVRHDLVQEKTLASPIYKEYVRYVLPGYSPFELALSLRSNSYLTHGTAVYLHGLTDQLPRTIYVNKEQSPKPESAGQLAQQSLGSWGRTWNLNFTLQSQPGLASESPIAEMRTRDDHISITTMQS